MGMWAFLVSVAYVPHVMSSAVAGRWWVIALGVPVVAEIRPKLGNVMLMALAMGFTWACASLWIAPDLRDSLLQLYFMALLIGVMFAASQQDSLDSAMVGMCAGVGVSLLVSIPAMFGRPWLPQSSDGFAGLFYNSEVLTEFGAPLLAWALVKRRWFLALIPLAPALANESRVALLSVGVALIVAFWPRAWKWRIAVLCGAAVLAGGAFVYVTMEGHRFASAALRLTIWLTTVYAIDPLGHGIGWYRAVHNTEEFSHSDVLQAFAELGVGALFFAAIPVYALMNRRDHAERAAFIVICVELVISFPLHVPASAFLAALLAGYLIRDRTGFRVLRFDGRDRDGADHEWHTAVRGSTHGGSGPGSFVFPLRSEVEGVSRLGLSQSSGG